MMDVKRLRKFDTVCGEVKKLMGHGVLVDIGASELCYCPACMTIGDKAYFSVIKYYEDIRGIHITLSFDSIIEYGIIAA